MKRTIAALLLFFVLCTSTACQLPFLPGEEPEGSVQTEATTATQAPGEENAPMPEAKAFSFVYGDDVNEAIRDLVGELRVLIKMEIYKVDLPVNPADATKHQIVVGGGSSLATAVRGELKPNTYTIRGVREGDAWSLLVVGNNQRSTLAALKRFGELVREKSWEEVLALNITESLNITYPSNVSIYGDSISTYPGVSNNAVKYNSTLAENKVWYDSSKLSPDEPWWKIVLNTLDAKLCVDNAYSGDYSYSAVALNRAKNLHRDAMGGIRNPDTIIVYFGINDCWKRIAEPTTKDFDECYGDLIRAMKESYPDAQIFCCTLLPGFEYKGDRLAPFNRCIRAVAKAEEVNLIDLDQLIGAEFLAKLPELTVDNENLHPNAKGMKMMGDAIAEAIEKWYYGE